MIFSFAIGNSLTGVSGWGATQVTTASLIIRSSPSGGPACGSTDALCPQMLTAAYNMTQMQKSGINGTGQAVVIDDACGDPTIASDLATFDSNYGLHNPVLHVYQPQGTPCSDSGWSVETSLDVEWAHVVAPGAVINLVEAAQPVDADLFGVWTYSMSHNLGNEISNSWGGSENCPSEALSALATATSKNITVLASAGDGNAWGEGINGVNFAPADCTQVLTVGGTTLRVQSSGAYISESAWSNEYGGTGGGYVGGTPEPVFQSSVKISDPYKVLAKSDVSADADPNTGVRVYNNGAGGWLIVGGTSVSCPLWAGFLADVNQARASHGLHHAGFLTPFLYDTVYGVSGGSTLYPKDFHDVTTGNDGWAATKGWDPPTGIGSFNAGELERTLGTSPTA